MKNVPGSNRRYTFVLTVVILFSALTLIAFNYYSIKLLAAVRGIRNGQFEYIKSQKNAVRTLSWYVYTQNEIYYQQFRNNLSIPIADNIARTAWEKGRSYKYVKKAFLRGKNDPKDINNVLWLLKNFSKLDYFKKGIHHWQVADSGIHQLELLGGKIHKKGQTGQLTQETKEQLISELESLIKILDRNESIFTTLLINALTQISTWILVFNIISIILIFLNVGLFFNKLIQKLNTALEEIEAQNRAKEEFLSVASHELKSPITFMKASIQILERFAKNTPETKKIHPFIVNSGKQVDRLNNLVKELLDVTKIQTGKLVLNKERFYLDELIKEAIEVKKQLHTHTLIIEELQSVKVDADPNRIYQVIENLLSNAMKYSQAETEVIVWSKVEGKQVKVSILDAGKGIPEEKQAMLFDRFYRVESTQHTVQGLGLGLYICSEIIKSHNGTIGVESKENQGSTFWFTLPILEDENGEEKKEALH